MYIQNIKRNKYMIDFSWFQPENVVLILHETPGERYSLVPGDALSKGSKIEKVKLGEMKTLGIDVQKKDRKVQRADGQCKDYDKGIFEK